MRLLTQRLELRPFEESDFAAFYAYASDPEVGRLSGAVFPDENAARSYFSRFLSPENLAFALVLRESGALIGDVTVHALPPILRDMDRFCGQHVRALSFSLSRDYWRQGLMSEALSALIPTLFAELHLDAVNCGYFEGNTASAALQEKLGFTYLTDYPIPWGDEPIRIVENLLEKPGK